MKILFLLVGLGVGFGGGVWWGVRNPERAEKLAAEEEKRVLEATIKATEALQKKLDGLIAKQRSGSGTARPGSSFVGGGTAGGFERDLMQLREEQQNELGAMKEKLKNLEGK